MDCLVLLSDLGSGLLGLSLFGLRAREFYISVAREDKSLKVSGLTPCRRRVSLQVVHADAYSFSLGDALWTVQAEVAPSCDEVGGCLGVPLSRLSQLSDADALLSAVEALKESALHLIPILDFSGWELAIPSEGSFSKSLDELPHQKWSTLSSVTTLRKKMSDVLSWRSSSVEVRELGLLVVWWKRHKVDVRRIGFLIPCT